MMRSVGAVVAGFLCVAVLSTAMDAVMHATGVFPPMDAPPMSDGLFAFATFYRTVFTVLGGWVTARIALRRPMAHAMVLAAIGVLAATAGAVATWNLNLGPRWYPLSLVVLAVPSVWAGAWLRVRQVSGQVQPA